MRGNQLMESSYTDNECPCRLSSTQVLIFLKFSDRKLYRNPCLLDNKCTSLISWIALLKRFQMRIDNLLEKPGLTRFRSIIV